MSQRFLTPIDLVKNELQNFRIQNLASAPSSPVVGQEYFDTVNSHAYVYNGASWEQASGAGISSVTLTGNVTGTGTSSIATTIAAGVVTNSMLAGSIAASKLIGTDQTTLGTITTGVWNGSAITSTYLPSLNNITLASADLSLNSHKITSLSDPTNPQDAATKNYVDMVAQGLSPKPSALAATTGALPTTPVYANGSSGAGATLTAGSNAAFPSIDGVAPVLNAYYVIKNEAATANNGLYKLTTLGTGSAPWVLTRAVEMDVASKYVGAYIYIESGTTNGTTSWAVTTAAPITVGTTGITFSQINSSGSYTAGTGISIAGNVISLSGTTVKKYSALIGDGTSTSIAITQATHGLASNGQMTVQLFDATTGNLSFSDLSINNSNGTVTFSFSVAPVSNAYRVVITG